MGNKKSSALLSAELKGACSDLRRLDVASLIEGIKSITCV